jgi:DNA-binding response OmpR family regulator
VVTYSSLATDLWTGKYPGANEAIRVYIHRLREKLEEDPNDPKMIKTAVNLGYIFRIPD